MLYPDYLLQGNQSGKLSVFSMKADYVLPISDNRNLEAGVKTSKIISDNDTKFFDVSTGTSILDTGKTNHFFYKEFNNAGYISFTQKKEKLEFQLGMRVEQTITHNSQNVGLHKFDSTYIQLFPNALVRYNLSNSKTIGLALKRRINRPAFADLNPFLNLIDATTYTLGNPFIRPETVTGVDLSYQFKQNQFNLSYSKSTLPITTVIIPYKHIFPLAAVADNITVQIPTNLLSTYYYSFSITSSFKPVTWWNLMMSTNTYFNYYKALLANTVLNKGRFGGDVSINNSFTSKFCTGEMIFSYNSPQRVDYMVLNSKWRLNVGAQKNIFKNKASVRVNLTDVFYKANLGGEVNYNNYKEIWRALRDTRVATITFMYRFGKTTNTVYRERKTASEEEKGRTNYR
jgi:hypothetical protein